MGPSLWVAPPNPPPPVFTSSPLDAKPSHLALNGMKSFRRLMAISPWFELPGFFDSLPGRADGVPGFVATGDNAETEVGGLDPASAVPVSTPGMGIYLEVKVLWPRRWYNS